MIKELVSTLLFAGLIATQALAADKIALNCSGQETLQVGSQPPTVGAYSHYVSIDLAANLVCYDRCTVFETYKVADGKSDPIKIADFNSATQSRHILYDPHAATLTDQTETVLGPIKIRSTAVAKCQAATYRQPPTPSK